MYLFRVILTAQLQAHYGNQYYGEDDGEHDEDGAHFLVYVCVEACVDEEVVDFGEEGEEVAGEGG